MPSREQLAAELSTELSRGSSIEEIARWAFETYVEHCRELDDDLVDILLELGNMDNPQFALSAEELWGLVERLSASA